MLAKAPIHLNFFLISGLSLLALTACGVKGPPLPPLTATPQETTRSDYPVRFSSPLPNASVTPSSTTQESK